jgi:hypothetical protein
LVETAPAMPTATTTRASQPTMARQGWVALQRAARIDTVVNGLGDMEILLLENWLMPPAS